MPIILDEASGITIPDAGPGNRQRFADQFHILIPARSAVCLGSLKEHAFELASRNPAEVSNGSLARLSPHESPFDLPFLCRRNEWTSWLVAE
jgi:hypothetical protein